MTLVREIKFTPELLITAPRRSTPSPNAAGTHAIYSVSTYDLDAHKEYKETRLFCIGDASSNIFSTDPGDSEPQWLGDSDLILYQRSTEGEDTELWIANAIGDKKAYYAGKIEAPVTELKTASLKNGNVGISFSAPCTSKGRIFNPKSADGPKHTGHEYTTHPIRIWDKYNPRHQFSLFYTSIGKQSDGRWKLNKEKPVNALKGTRLQYPLGPGAVLGETGSYAIGPRGLLLCGPPPDINFALRIEFRPYFIALDTFEEKKPTVFGVKVPEFVGSVTSPAFSTKGNVLSFVIDRTPLMMDTDKGIAVVDLDNESVYQDSHVMGKLIKFREGGQITWDRFPSELIWSHDDNELYIVAEDYGNVRLFKLDADASSFKTWSASRLTSAPKALTEDIFGSVSSVSPLGKKTKTQELLLASSSYIEPSLFSILDTKTGHIKHISSISSDGKDYGLRREQYDTVSFSGDKSDEQAHILRPSHFEKGRKYPIALLVHGGPQSAWNNAWSTRWNAALWAEQGYVVLMPNPSGSTGFGLEIFSSVGGDWGGRCYRDIVKAVDYLCDNYDYVDSSTIIMAGGSFGGYMANWIAGQPLAKRLKAIVSHDGVFHSSSMYASDFTSDLGHEVGSELWEDTKPWEKWSPANYTKTWHVPMLIVHSELDYRCPINEGLAPYAVCQAMGIPSRFLYFPDENHWVLKRENNLKWQKTVLGWFNYYAGVKDGVKLEEAECDAKFEDDDENEEKLPLR